MNKFLQRGVVVFASVALLAGLAVPLAQAQTGSNGTGNGFRISPVRAEYVIEKGKSTTLSITLENPSDVSVTAQAVINDFVASDKEDGEPRLILDTNAKPPKNSFRTIAQVTDEVKLAAREKKEITVTLKVPADANAGGYYGAVRFVPVAGAADAGNVGLTASVGTIVLIRVPGELIEKANIEQLTAAKNGKATSFFTTGDVGVLARIHNTGDIHVQPFGKVVVKNMFGKKVKEYELNPDKSSVLPDSIRRYEESIAKPKGGWLGRYTIEANVGYAQGSGDVLSVKSAFWYLPVWAIIVLLVLLVGVGIGAYLLIRKYGGEHNHRAKK